MYASKEKPWLKYYPKYLIDKPMPKCTIYEHILNGNNLYPNRCAINYYGNKIKYKTLIKNIDITARSFISLGVKKGDIITVITPTTPEFVYIFYALSKLGVILNLIDPRKSSEEIFEYTNKVKSKHVVVLDVALEKVLKIKEDLNLEKIILLSPADSMTRSMKKLYKIKTIGLNTKDTDIIKWKDFYKMGLDRENDIIVDEYPKYEENTPLAIVYTGGTTGKSKGVMLSNDNLNSVAYQCATCGYDFRRGHKWLDIMPPFIVYGVGVGLHLPLSLGIEVILVPAFNPDKFDKLLTKYEPNHITGVPTHYDSVVKSKKIKTLKYLYSPIVGGDKLDEKSEVIINEYFKKQECIFNVSKGYGMSEVSAAVCTTSIPEMNKLGSVGAPFHHTDIAIFEPGTTKEKKYNEIGEVCISGPNVMLGYFGNEKETTKILKKHLDGKVWVHSGDLGYMDEDGILFIKGRIKEMIIRYDGFKVFPVSIEEVILTHPLVKECKVVGIRDKNYSQGELPKAYITLEKRVDDKEKIIKEVKDLCKEKLAEYLQPAQIEIKNSLPLTSIGKIDYMKLKEENETKLVNI